MLTKSLVPGRSLTASEPGVIVTPSQPTVGPSVHTLHERSLVRDLLDQLAELSDENGLSNAVLVRVEVGEFSGVEPELFESGFEELRLGTAFERTTLELVVVPAIGACRCGHEFRVARSRFVCPVCRDGRVEVVSGEDVVLSSVTFEEPEPVGGGSR